MVSILMPPGYTHIWAYPPNGQPGLKQKNSYFHSTVQEKHIP